MPTSGAGGVRNHYCNLKEGLLLPSLPLPPFQEGTDAPFGKGAAQPLDSRHARERKLQVRIGIHTGPVVVGEIGSGASTRTAGIRRDAELAARVQGKLLLTRSP